MRISFRRICRVQRGPLQSLRAFLAVFLQWENLMEILATIAQWLLISEKFATACMPIVRLQSRQCGFNRVFFLIEIRYTRSAGFAVLHEMMMMMLGIVLPSALDALLCC
jgi:hypothetical protein